MRFALPALVAIALGACSSLREPDPGFGPVAHGPERAEQTRHARAKPDRPAMVAPAYAGSTTLPQSKALTVRRVRIDDGDNLTQNYEVQLEVLHADAFSADGDELLAAWMTGTPGEDGRTRTRLAVASSIDGGRAFAPVEPEFPVQDQPLQFDPTVGVDPVTGKAFVGIVFQDENAERTLLVAASDGPGATRFLPAVVADTGYGLDKPWIAAGPQPGLGPVVYLTDRIGLRVSTDQGRSWSDPVPLPRHNNLLQPLALPDGTLVVSYLSETGQSVFARIAPETPPRASSLHMFAGSSSELRGAALPGGFRAAETAQVAHDPSSGRLYAVVHDITRREGDEGDLDILLKQSDNGGTRWSAGRNVTADLTPYSDQFLPWIAVDAAGGLHLAYMEAAVPDGGDAAVDADVHVWYAHSTDFGTSWTRQRLTPQPIPSSATHWLPLQAAESAQFLGDYFTVDVSQHAAYVAHPVYENGGVGMAVSRIDLTGTSAPIRDPRGLSGLWFEPSTSGQGFQFDWISGENLTVVFYGHRDDGSNLFLTGVHAGLLTYGAPVDVTLYRTTGGRFNAYDANTITTEPWGALQLRFNSCTHATATLQGIDGGKQMQLERLATAPDLPCD